MTSPVQDICSNCRQPKSSGLCPWHCFTCGRPRLEFRKFRGSLTPLDKIGFGYCNCTYHDGPGLIKQFTEWLWKVCEWVGFVIAYAFSAMKIFQRRKPMSRCSIPPSIKHAECHVCGAQATFKCTRCGQLACSAHWFYSNALQCLPCQKLWDEENTKAKERANS